MSKFSGLPEPGHVRFVIGSAKCGTTSIFDGLKQLPSVCVGPKEPNFFSSDTNYAKGLDSYLRLFSNWDPAVHTAILDASASYTEFPKNPHCARRIAAFHPKAKLIYLVRDPIDRIKSHNRMQMAHGWPSIEADSNLERFYTDISRYHLQLTRYREQFSENAILVVSFNDLISDSKQAVSSIAKHFELEGAERVKAVWAHNGSKLYLMYFIKRALKKSGRLPERSTTSEAVSFFNALTEPEKDQVNREAEELFSVSRQMEDRIRKSLASDMHLLAGEYGIDVSRWGY